MKDGVNATPLPTVNTTGYIDHAAFLGTINPDTNKIPKHLFQGYLNIYNNYFKAPWMPDRTEANPNLHTDQERDYFMQCYHDVISSFGGKTSYDADNRPLLVMRSNLWASGYDVDGTDQTSLGQ